MAALFSVSYFPNNSYDFCTKIRLSCKIFFPCLELCMYSRHVYLRNFHSLYNFQNDLPQSLTCSSMAVTSLLENIYPSTLVILILFLMTPTYSYLDSHLTFFFMTHDLLILQRTCNALWIRSGGPRRALYLGGCCQPLPGIPPNQPGSQPRRGCPSGPAPRDLGAWRHQRSLPLPSFEMKEGRCFRCPLLFLRPRTASFLQMLFESDKTLLQTRWFLQEIRDQFQKEKQS